MPMHEVAESGPKVIVRGEGSLVWDVEGKEYLDAMGGIYTTPIGHGRADVIEAICEQGRKLEFYPNFQFYTTPPVIELAEKLTALYPADMKRWFFCSGGSEAMDTALKIARQYWKQSGKPGKHKFIALRGGFHGVTFGAASATGILISGQRAGTADNSRRVRKWKVMASGFASSKARDQASVSNS